jgi:hypothetical protein
MPKISHGESCSLLTDRAGGRQPPRCLPFEKKKDSSVGRQSQGKWPLQGALSILLWP